MESSPWLPEVVCAPALSDISVLGHREGQRLRVGSVQPDVRGPGQHARSWRDRLYRVDGSRAWIGNKITSSGNPVLVGNQGGFDVEDNGEGQESTDRLSRTFVDGAPDGGLAQDVCDGATFIEFDAVDIDKGNIQVH